MNQGKISKKRERPKYNMWQNTAYMIRKAWQVRKSVIWLVLVMVVLATAVNLTELFIAPVILQRIEAQVGLKELLSTILGFAGFAVLLAALYNYVEGNIIFGRTHVRIILMREAHYKIATTSYPNTENTRVLQMVEKVEYALSSNYRASQSIWDTWTEILKNIIGFGIYLYLLSEVNGWLMIIVAVSAVVGYFVNKRIYQWGYLHKEEEDGYIDKMSYISDKTGERKLAKDIRIFGMREWLEDIFQSTLRLYEAFLIRREKVYLVAALIDVLLSVLRNGIAYVYLINMTLTRGLPASEFLLYFTAISGFTAWITGILNSFTKLYQESLELSNIREFLELPEPFLFEEGKTLRADLNKDYTIELKDVSFRYPEAEKDTLSHVNLTLHPGEKLAVVGLNGAGKTTLVKLLIGLYDPSEGQVLLNGTDIRRYNRRDYYKLFSAVFQQFSLLEVSVAENVAQSAEEIDMVRMEACVEKAGLKEKINSLSQGYDTHLGRAVFEDGIELSGGENQRLMLARALYKNAPIIVLDEPTAALDPIAENDIYLKYNEMTQGRSSVYISHRLASTRFCDRIVLLEDGRITEEGTHEGLLAAGGKYAELFEIQSRYYREGGAPDEQ